MENTIQTPPAEFICQDSTLIALLSRIIELTERKEIIWRRSADIYYPSFNPSVPVSKSLDRFGFSLRTSLSDDDPQIIISVCHHCQTLSKAYSPADSKIWDPLSSLFALALKSSKTVESALQSMLSYLDELNSETMPL